MEEEVIIDTLEGEEKGEEEVNQISSTREEEGRLVLRYMNRIR